MLESPGLEWDLLGDKVFTDDPVKARPLGGPICLHPFKKGGVFKHAHTHRTESQVMMRAEIYRPRNTEDGQQAPRN